MKNYNFFSCWVSFFLSILFHFFLLYSSFMTIFLKQKNSFHWQYFFFVIWIFRSDSFVSVTAFITFWEGVFLWRVCKLNDFYLVNSNFILSRIVISFYIRCWVINDILFDLVRMYVEFMLGLFFFDSIGFTV